MYSSFKLHAAAAAAVAAAAAAAAAAAGARANAHHDQLLHFAAVLESLQLDQLPRVIERGLPEQWDGTEYNG